MLTAQQVEDRAAQKRARRVVRHFDAGLIEVLYADGGFEVWMSEGPRAGFQMIRASAPTAETRAQMAARVTARLMCEVQS